MSIQLVASILSRSGPAEAASCHPGLSGSRSQEGGGRNNPGKACIKQGIGNSIQGKPNSQKGGDEKLLVQQSRSENESFNGAGEKAISYHPQLITQGE